MPLALVGCFVSAAQAQWPWDNLFRPSAESKVVSATPHPAVARVTVQEKDGISFGTGSLVDARGNFGLVITNWHVVRDAAGDITVEFPSGQRVPVKRLLKIDADWDLAALEIARPAGIQPLPISSAMPQKGDSLVIAGYGAGNYRAAAGKCQQFLAPKEGMPFEMIELNAEARQGDSGGPIFNERGEIAGVLFGAEKGFTVGSYGGRVLAFLQGIVPDGSPGSDAPGGPLNSSGLTKAHSPSLSPTAEHVPRNDPFIAAGPQVQDQLRAMADPPAALSVPPNLPGSPPHMVAPPPAETDRLAMVPLPSRRNAAVVPPSTDPPSRLEVNRDLIAPLETPARVRSDQMPSVDLSPPESAITPAEGPPATAVLPPRKGAQDADSGNLQDAPTGQLLAAAWKQIGGDTIREQVKTVLAAFGVLGMLVFVWKFMSREDAEVEAE